MTTTVGSQKLVLDYSRECKGLQREMPLQQVLSLYVEAELIQADIPYYWDVFNETLDFMEEKSPLVEGSDLEAIYIGLDGLELAVLFYTKEFNTAGSWRNQTENHTDGSALIGPIRT